MRLRPLIRSAIDQFAFGGHGCLRALSDLAQYLRCGRAAPAPSPWEAAVVTTPLYQLKADFFKTLGHPIRIRVLELLSQREHAVAEMLPEVGVEAAHLSQQLAILRRSNLVATRKEGSTVYYRLTNPELADLLAVARSILGGVLAGQAELLQDLRTASPPAAATRRARPA